MIYMTDKPAITLADITVRVKSFESEQFAGYANSIMSGVNKVEYIEVNGYLYCTVSAGFPNGSDVKMVVEVSYVIGTVQYVQELTFVGNAYQVQ